MTIPNYALCSASRPGKDVAVGLGWGMGCWRLPSIRRHPPRSHQGLTRALPPASPAEKPLGPARGSTALRAAVTGSRPAAAHRPRPGTWARGSSDGSSSSSPAAVGGARTATEVELARGRAASLPSAARPLQAGGSYGGSAYNLHLTHSPLFLNIRPIPFTK